MKLCEKLDQLSKQLAAQLITAAVLCSAGCFNQYVHPFTDRIYQYQQYGYSFSTVERLLHAMGGDGFLTLMNQTLEEAMMGDGFSQIFLNDIVAPITRVNYGQSVRINGFVGMCYDVRA